jgi:uncharacterized protein
MSTPLQSRWKHENQSPWAIRIADTSRRPGRSQEIDSTFPAPSGIGDDFYGIHEGSDIHMTGHLDSIEDGLILSARATAHVTGQCARCLKDISGPITISLTVFFPYHLSEAEDADRTGRGKDAREKEIIADEEAGQDMYPLAEGGTYADVEALLRDSFVDALPTTPLCKPDCKGLCPLDGVNLNDHPEHHHEQHDIRWAALEGLKQQLENQAQNSSKHTNAHSANSQSRHNQ